MHAGIFTRRRSHRGKRQDMSSRAIARDLGGWVVRQAHGSSVPRFLGGHPGDPTEEPRNRGTEEPCASRPDHPGPSLTLGMTNVQALITGVIRSRFFQFPAPVIGDCVAKNEDHENGHNDHTSNEPWKHDGRLLDRCFVRARSEIANELRGKVGSARLSSSTKRIGEDSLM